MDHQLDLQRPVAEEVRRIADALLTDAVARADGPEDLDDAIHEVRKRGKETRGLLRLVRGAAEQLHQRENAAVRDAARLLSEVRDATAAIETFDALATSFDDTAVSTMVDVRAALDRRRERIHTERDAARLLGRAAEAMDEVRARIPGWQLDDDGFDAIAGGLAKTYGRARRRMDDAATDPSSEAWHEWRKRAKYHRYHLALLQGIWPPVLRTRRDEVHRLTDLLGDDHDLAVLRADALDDLAAELDAETLQLFLALVDRRRAELQAEAQPLGRRVLAEDTDAFVARARELWDATIDAPDPTELADPAIPPGR